MKIAVLGTGNVGSALGLRWAGCGHSVTFGSREPDSPRVQAVLDQAEGDVSATGQEAAAEGADVIVLATPWFEAEQLLSRLGGLAGKILIDCSNPLTADFSGLDVGHTTSAAERIASWSPEARVVKAFNSVSARLMSDPSFGQDRAALIYCGDDDEAKQVVHELAEELGFEAVDAGPLRNARFLEPMAMLYIQLMINQDWGSNFAFKIMHRD